MKHSIAPSTSALVSAMNETAKSVLQAVMHHSVTGKFLAFNYTDSKGRVSRKVYRFGGDVAKKMEKERAASVAAFVAANPGVAYTVKTDSKGNWVTAAKKSGVRQGVMEYSGKVYVRGTCTKSREIRTLSLGNITL